MAARSDMGPWGFQSHTQDLVVLLTLPSMHVPRSSRSACSSGQSSSSRHGWNGSGMKWDQNDSVHTPIISQNAPVLAVLVILSQLSSMHF